MILDLFKLTGKKCTGDRAAKGTRCRHRRCARRGGSQCHVIDGFAMAFCNPELKCAGAEGTTEAGFQCVASTNRSHLRLRGVAAPHSMANSFPTIVRLGTRHSVK